MSIKETKREIEAQQEMLSKNQEEVLRLRKLKLWRAENIKSQKALALQNPVEEQEAMDLDDLVGGVEDYQNNDLNLHEN
jgi:hypothetical protein